MAIADAVINTDTAAFANEGVVAVTVAFSLLFSFSFFLILFLLLGGRVGCLVIVVLGALVVVVVLGV